ncbi:MAG: hypothetical protein DCC68_12990 [Planctomycetota bacterium]|nr:MAG: hypothetical protein DCC68_12990 [Planctomycetota bacterium]
MTRDPACRSSQAASGRAFGETLDPPRLASDVCQAGADLAIREWSSGTPLGLTYALTAARA